MPQPTQEYVNSARFYNSHEYLNRDRALPLVQSELRYATAGHLLETYVDALHVVLLLNEPSFLRRVKESPETIRNPTFIRPTHRLPPRYVIDAIGNYLESPSFFVKHLIGKSNEPARQDSKQASATQFAQEVHAHLRQVAKRFTEKLSVEYFPPKGLGELLNAGARSEIKRADPQGACERLNLILDEYPKLFQKFLQSYRAQYFSQTQTLTATQKLQIFEKFQQSSELKNYEARLEIEINAVKAALTPPNLSFVFLRHADEYSQVLNSPLNPEFIFSTPALLLFAAHRVSKHQIDQTFVPKKMFGFLLNVIGVESNVSDHLDKLSQRLNDGQLLFPESERKVFFQSVTSHSRGIQFLHLFHRTAGILEKIYPLERAQIAFQDMEQTLASVGLETTLLNLQTPAEAAALIFAIERRLRATSTLETKLYNQIGELLNKAEHLGKKRLFPFQDSRLARDIISLLQAVEQDDEILMNDRAYIFPAIQLIKKSFIPKKHHHAVN